MLITFEGIEGCGKTTQIELLGDHLVRQGYSVVRTREPGGTPFGEALRELLLKKGMDVDPLCELMVFMAMRAQHVDEVILPALKEGRIVLCDRFTDATYAYQGSGRKIDTATIDALNAMVTQGIRPNLTILLDITVEKGLRRRAASFSVVMAKLASALRSSDPPARPVTTMSSRSPLRVPSPGSC